MGRLGDKVKKGNREEEKPEELAAVFDNRWANDWFILLADWGKIWIKESDGSNPTQKFFHLIPQSNLLL